MRTNIRQGDVLLMPVDRLPDGLVELAATPEDGVVLARGEGHGHRHMLPYGGAVLLMDTTTGSTFVDVKQATKLAQLGPDNQETGDHATLDVPAGSYEVRRQSEAAAEEQAVGRVD